MLIGSEGITFLEILYVCITLCCTVGVFGYLLGSISKIQHNYFTLIIFFLYFRFNYC